MNQVKCTRLALGDTAWQWSFGHELSSLLSEHVLRIFHALMTDHSLSGLGVHDIVPTYSAVAVYFSRYSSESERQAIAVRVEALIDRIQFDEDASSVPDRVVYEFCVDYSGEDLLEVAQHTGLTVQEVITRHSQGVYQVAMIGFQPHFPYLLGLDPKLQMPRRSSPRTAVKAGAVAIGGAQTGIYPTSSPGGWNIIGYTSVVQLPQLNPGDYLRFKPITVNV